MKKWKVSLGVVIGVLLLVLGFFTLNNRSINKAPASPNQTTVTPKTQTQTPTQAQAQTKTQTQNTIIDPNAAKFQGKDNFAKYEGIAQKNPTSAADQVNAAVSAYVNQDYDKAVTYYKNAIALQPKNAQYLTYLGNVYFRGLNSPQDAVPYYQAATQSDPRYVYGWWNLALCQKTLGDKDAAKATLQKGVASVDPKDPLAKQLQLQLDALK